jgi:hypothetical protein
MAKRKKVKDSWHAAVCYNARSVASLIRESLEDLDYNYTRDKGEKGTTRLVVVVPIPEFSYVFKFIVSGPTKFIINTYDVRPTHSGEVHIIEVQDITEDNLEDVQRLLKHFAEKLPRKPWKFFWSERLRYGIIQTEYLEAKSAWYSMGVS